MDNKEEVKAETSKEEVKLEKSYTNNSFFIPTIIFIFFLAVCGWLIWQNQQTRTILEKFKTETLNEIQTCSTDDKNSIYSKRLENLENKYIDISASNQNINFWITIFSILIPLVLGYQIYQKGKFEEESRKELDRVRDFAEKVREKIDNIDKIVDNKIEEITIKSEGVLINIDKVVNSKIKEIAKKTVEETTLIASEAERQRQISDYFSNGLSLSNLGEYEEAIKMYDKIIELDNKYSYAYNNKGNALSKLGKIEEAIKMFDKTIELDNKSKEPYYNKGTALSKLGKYDDAIKMFDKTIELDNKYSKAYNNKGNALSNLGKYDDAIKMFDKAIESDNKYSKAYHNKGNTLSKLGRTEEAEKMYKKEKNIKDNQEKDKNLD